MRFKQKLMMLSIVISITSFAGSIDYLSQQDAEYLAHPAMVGKIGVSGAYYNPAGLIWLEDGVYMQLNNQTHFKKYSMSYNDENFKSDKPSPVVPSIQIVSKKGDTAYFFHAGAIGGGGSVSYNGGIATFPQLIEDNPLIKNMLHAKYNREESSSIHGKSFYVAVQAGIAKKINTAWSGAVGVRIVSAKREFSGTGQFEGQLPKYLGGKKIYPKFDIDSKRTATGVTGIFGLNYHPNDRFNLGIRYETETELKFHNKEHKLREGFKNSSPGKLGDILYDIMGKNKAIKQWMAEGSGKRNLPAMAALGVSYKVNKKLTLLGSGNYYFIKQAENSLGNFDNYDNGYELAVGLDYQLNKKWILMAGYQYTDTGANADTYTDTDYVLDADMYSAGIKYLYSSKLELIASYSYVQYRSDKSIKNIEYNKRVNAIGLGLVYKF